MEKSPSTFFSSRPLPGLESVPEGGVALVGGGSGTPESDNGDAMTIMTLTVYGTPLEMMDAKSRKSSGVAGGSQGAAPRAGPTQEVTSSVSALTLDLRCSNCTKSFVDANALLAHCKESGHFAVTSSDENIVPANIEVFTQYANVVLDRAMSERLAKWGQ